MVYVCVYVYTHVLTSIFMQADMHEYVGMHIYVYVYVTQGWSLDSKVFHSCSGHFTSNDRDI